MTSYLPYTMHNEIIRTQSPTRTFGASTTRPSNEPAYDPKVPAVMDDRNGIGYKAPRTRAIQANIDTKNPIEFRPYTLGTEVASRNVTNTGVHNTRGVELNMTASGANANEVDFSAPNASYNTYTTREVVDLSGTSGGYASAGGYGASSGLGASAMNLMYNTVAEGPRNISPGYAFEFPGPTSVDNRNGVSYSNENSPMGTMVTKTIATYPAAYAPVPVNNYAPVPVNNYVNYAPVNTSYDHVKLSRSLDGLSGTSGGVQSYVVHTTTDGRSSPGLDYNYGGPVALDERNGLRYASPQQR